jgi:xanthine dehydrogenase accessory factor
MRKLSELIVLVRGGGEVGTAIAHRLYRSHFRVCITEIASPLAINRGSSFSEAIFETSMTVEGVTAERSLPNLEQIYKVWRNDNIPVVADAELSVKPLLKADVLINAMMLKRKTNTNLSDAPLVIGIGPGFTAGEDVHLVIESHSGHNLGKVLVEGSAEDESELDSGIDSQTGTRVICAEDAGIFSTQNNIGDAILTEDEIGRLNDVPIKAPLSGMIRGILRDEMKVLSNTRLIEIDPKSDKSVCFLMRDIMRSVAGGALEAILMSLNLAETS